MGMPTSRCRHRVGTAWHRVGTAWAPRGTAWHRVGTAWHRVGTVWAPRGTAWHRVLGNPGNFLKNFNWVFIQRKNKCWGTITAHLGNLLHLLMSGE